VALPNPLFGALTAARLVNESGEEGWSFAHAMVAEVLRERAAGALESHHGAVASMLEERGDAGGRLGRHLILCGRDADALEPLLAGARKHLEYTEHRQADGLLRMWADAAKRCRIRPSDPRHGGWLDVCAYVLDVQQRYDEAEAIAVELRDRAEKRGWLTLELRALLRLGYLSYRRGQFAEGADRIDGALLKDDGSAAEWTCLALICKGGCLAQGGKHGAARPVLVRALELSASLPTQHGVLGTRLGLTAQVFLALVALNAGELAEAEGLAATALEGFVQMGNRHNVAWASEILGLARRKRGDLAGAADAFRKTMQQNEALGRPATLLVDRLNYAVVSLLAGQHAEALQHFRGAEIGFRRRSLSVFEAASALGVHAARARLADWEGWLESFEGVRAALEESGFIEADNALLAEEATRAAVSAGRDQEAALAGALAVAHWRLLKSDARAEALMDLVSGSTIP
jgi:tetratricopeptide (TPR) repeat protein